MNNIVLLHGEGFIVEVLENWEHSPAENVRHWIKTLLSIYENNLCMEEYREDRPYKRAMTKLENKLYVQDTIREHHGKTVVNSFAAKIWLLMVKPLTGSAIGSAADIIQFAVEYCGGYTWIGKMVGATGNTIYGAHDRGSRIGVTVGGALGFGLWLFSDTHLSSALTEDIYTV